MSSTKTTPDADLLETEEKHQAERHTQLFQTIGSCPFCQHGMRQLGMI